MFAIHKMIAAFSIARIRKANARFDGAKLLAANTTAIAAATPSRLLAAFKDFLSLNDTPIPAGDDALLVALLRANRGLRTFADIVVRAGVLFIADDAFDYDAQAVAKVLAKADGAGFAMLAELRGALAGCEWNKDALHALIERICRDKQVGMGKVAQPIRVAVAGTTVSPGIVETLMLLGKDKALARIDRCLTLRGVHA